MASETFPDIPSRRNLKFKDMSVNLYLYRFTRPYAKDEIKALLFECSLMGELDGTYGDYIEDTDTLCILVARDHDSEGVGYLIAAAYPTTHCHRASQWVLGYNRERTLWIGDMAVTTKGRGLGSHLLAEFEKHAKSIEHDGKQNIYVSSIHATGGFYARNGYACITTPDHDDDEDHPGVFEVEHGCWFAKNITDPELPPIGEKMRYPREGKLTTWHQLDAAILCHDLVAIKRAFAVPLMDEDDAYDDNDTNDAMLRIAKVIMSIYETNPDSFRI